MTDTRGLPQLTQSYLKRLIANTVGSMDAEFDSATSFGELGVDSFRVLKIIKALEADFGTLPKTLLFECFNIDDLAQYFVDKHGEKLAAKFASLTPGAAATSGPAAPAAAPCAGTSRPVAATPVAPAAPRAPAQLPAGPRPVLMTEVAALAHPVLGNTLRDILSHHKNEGSVSRGTRNIAPNLFIGSERKGFFNYARSRDILLAYTYTGPREYFATLAQELHAHCVRQRLELNLIADEELSSIGTVAFSSTPFGGLQRILNLQEFTLEGGAMRRLRYQVSKFEKAGRCRTEEYFRGVHPEPATNIAAVIDQWCAARTMVNPLIHIVKEEILAGTLSRDHRIFLTYLDDALQNVILLSPLSARQNGYLMDLEFYPPAMPLGGLEYAIVRIIETLIAEGCAVLSMGGTYGCKLVQSANADPEVDRILDELRLQNIFNDEGNLQFKNKFRPQNTPIFLCRPKGECTPGNVLDVIMMIADPKTMQTSDEEHQGLREEPDMRPSVIEGEARSALLADCGFNPLNVPNAQVEFDLKTDSWAQLTMPAIDNRARHLHVRLQQPAELDSSLRAIFPFAHFALTTSGRTAERAFYTALAHSGFAAQPGVRRPDGKLPAAKLPDAEAVVPQNLLFPTVICHQIDQGFTPVEIPQRAVFDLGSNERFKGDLDVEALEKLLAETPHIPFVCMELSDNAAGGAAVSLANLRRVKEKLAARSIPLVLDATRVLENAWCLIEQECAGQTVWEVARALLGCADAVHVSLAKDFCIKGGLIATNDAALLGEVQARIREQGCGLGAIERRLAALAFADRGYLETQTQRRRQLVKQLFGVLDAHGIPLARPAGAHCLLIDVKKLPELAGFEHPVASFLAWLYLNTGIRAGAHSAGMQSGTALNDLVRIAIPVGLKQEQVAAIGERLIAAFAARKNIPEIVPVNAGAVADIHAHYRLVRYHNFSGALVARPSIEPAATATATAIAAEPVARPLPTHRGADIAIVGMAGRYPKARNLHELWDNLVRGVDCTEVIPDERQEQRPANGFTRGYRGGFIDGVDRFDARFFSVAPKDAALLDPQERLFLEVAYEAIEDAGYYPESLGSTQGSTQGSIPGDTTGRGEAADAGARDIGVFVGAVWSMYQMLGLEEKIAGNRVDPSSFFWSIANRVSYWMNLSGPSLTIDTACSASLTAVNLACEAIRRGDCSAAIVGGVNLDLHQSKFDINSAGGALSADGVCRAFGKGANGYVQGEGVGALFLKPLDRAIADGDNIHGIIKSAVVTHTGRTSGYMVPSPHPQSRMIAMALERANVDARSIGYVEAHGTGTDLGDTIEIKALTKVFQAQGAAARSCPIGTIKPGIGHLEAASGIVGLQKILLQMKHRKLVPSLHSAQTNEGIDFASTPFYVQQQVEEWRTREIDGVPVPRRAGISAIGAGGTNAHVIVEEYVPAAEPATQRPEPAELVFPLSAKSEPQLREAALRLRDFLHAARDANVPAAVDIAYTLQIGRKAFEQRLAIVANGSADLVQKLDAFLAGRTHDDVMPGQSRNAEKVTAYLSHGERAAFVNLLVQSRDPRRLARFWSDGVLPDFRGIEPGPKGRRVSLPTYPFVDERYWITQRRKAAPAAARAEPAAVHVAREETHAAPIRWADSYQFSLARDNRTLAGKLSGLSVGDKARLFARQMFAAQLRVSIDDVNDGAQLMDTGLTSLDMAEMTQSIKERIDPAFSPVAFFECTTVRSFAELLAREYSATFDEMTVTKIAAEDGKTRARLQEPVARTRTTPEGGDVPAHVRDAQSELPLPDFKAFAQGSDAQAASSRDVLLTGATGFLGIHVLAELLDAQPDANVYCLVRAASAKHGLRRIQLQAEKFELVLDAERIRVFCGDLRQPQLGLSREDWERCARDTQQIVHASAHVNHIEGYATFRDSTQGMKEIIRLAGTHRLKLVQFVSSVAGCALKNGNEFSFFEKEDFVPQGEHVYGGYGQSKWVQETFLRRAHDQGLPFVIHRFGELSGSSRTGLNQTEDMLHRLVQMRLAVGCREKVSSDVLDMLPVDVAAKLIVGAGRTPALWNRIVHATHLKPYGIANLYRRAEGAGLEFKPVTRTQYVAECREFVRYVYSLNAVHGFVLECVLRDAEGAIRNRQMMDGYFSVIFPFEQANFKRALQALALELPAWPALIDRYFERWGADDSGFLARIFEYRKWARLDEAARAAVIARNLAAPKGANEPAKKPARKGPADVAMLESVHEA